MLACVVVVAVLDVVLVVLVFIPLPGSVFCGWSVGGKFVGCLLSIVSNVEKKKYICALIVQHTHTLNI